jgi:hypothetical protein
MTGCCDQAENDGCGLNGFFSPFQIPRKVISVNAETDDDGEQATAVASTGRISAIDPPRMSTGIPTIGKALYVASNAFKWPGHDIDRHERY